MWNGPATKQPYVSKSRYLSKKGGLKNDRRAAHLSRLAEEEAKAKEERDRVDPMDALFDSGMDALFADMPDSEPMKASKSLPALKLTPNRLARGTLHLEMIAAKRRGQQPRSVVQYRENPGQNDVKVKVVKINYGSFTNVPRVLM